MGRSILAGLDLGPVSHDLPLGLSVRHMIERDLRAVSEIHQAASPWGWSRTRIRDFLRSRGGYGLVAESCGAVVGFALITMRRPTQEIREFVVDSEYRGLGVGSALMAKLATRLGSSWEAIRFDVRETDLPCQLFLQSHGFLARRVLRGHFPDSGEDAFEMVLTSDRARLARPGFLGRGGGV